MRRLAVIAVLLGTLGWVQAAEARGPGAAALQVALRAHDLYVGPIDGVFGPMTRAGLRRFQQRNGLPATGRLGRRTRVALGMLGRPLLGQREIGIGSIGWDVSSLEFRLSRAGLSPGRVDGRFDLRTARALRRFQTTAGLHADGIAGPRTFRALAQSPAEARLVHSVRAGESFFSIAQRYRVSPWLLAKENGLRLTQVIVPGQRLRLPPGARPAGSVQVTGGATRDEVRASIDRWSSAYGVDPALARALAWMESGFQDDVVSEVGAVGVMQLLPETWEWVDAMLIGHPTPRTADGNVQAGVRYLRWQLDEFGGSVRLALAGWYQGARAVREIGLYDDTKQFVSVVQQLYGQV